MNISQFSFVEYWRHWYDLFKLYSSKTNNVNYKPFVTFDQEKKPKIVSSNLPPATCENVRDIWFKMAQNTKGGPLDERIFFSKKFSDMDKSRHNKPRCYSVQLEK